MGQPPLMLLSLTIEGTAGTRRLALYMSVYFTQLVQHTSLENCALIQKLIEL